ncbi:hypothetical protein D9619_005458 [Psilocybe cf. subviscida]|uniref:DNA (cytosine-5-)-methyltransferase n=1 Tax=Psilocybe cf. subviscida TaxID=2480587 RepID=A0A8H5BWK0_9AGAR|nr:hypothetical protein D9619_005458 [Psilocybe cf. subviscida]
MANRRPYVEILYKPNLRRRFKTPSPEPDFNSLDSSENERLMSPRKKQRVESTSNQTDPESEDIFPMSSCVQDEGISDLLPESEVETSVNILTHASTILYKLAKNEIPETEDITVPGETNTDADDLDPQVPVRTLSDFSIYDRHTKALVPITKLLEMETSGREFGASGLVGPWIETDDEDSQRDGSPFGDDASVSSEPEDEYRSPLRLNLNYIVDINVHHITETKDIDSKIYLETEQAWYILLSPSPAYAPFFSTFWTQSRICNLCLLHAVQSPRTTLLQFIAKLPSLDFEDDAVRTTFDILGRELSEDDFCDDTKAYVAHTLNVVCSQNQLDISRVPLVRELIGTRTYVFAPSIQLPAVPKAPHPQEHREIRRRQSGPSQTSNKSKSDKPKTFLTPIVNRIAEKLFEGSLEVAAAVRDESLEQKEACIRHHEHPFDPESVVWGRELERGVYSSVIIDGVVYSIGDYVMTQPPQEWLQSQTQASRTVNFYGNHYWFCQIRYFFDGIIVGMELFSGAGGLGLGMDLSAFVETKYAVEYSASAAKTYHDLKKFDWENPHVYLPSLPQDEIVKQMRLNNLSIPAFDAVASVNTLDFYALPGFPEGINYGQEPQNSFQQWIRLAMGQEDQVTGHYTPRFSSQIVEGTVTVPLVPSANHHDLPAVLLPQFAQKPTFKHVLYGRIDAHGFFKCQVTTLSPVLRNQYPLHPTQKRIITVREAARCQGFPDEYTFESTSNKTTTIVSDQLKQIGNAVAVPFALALGKELGKALVSDWEQTRRERSVSL